MVNSHGRFVWYELMTTDTENAKAFYADVVGWGARDASMPGLAYSLFTVGESPVAGLVNVPEDARRMGATPHWIGYVGVDDVDAAVDRIKQLGGAVYVPPTDVPNISRFSVVADPQMATLALVKGLKSGQAQSAELGAPGRVGWHELLAADWEKAFAFYGELFGWQKADSHVGAMGTYQRSPPEGRRSAACSPSLRPCRFPSGFTISTSTTSRRRRSAWKPAAAKSYMAQLQCRAAPGSSIARTLRAPYSRCWTGEAAKRLDILFRARRIARSADAPGRRWLGKLEPQMNRYAPPILAVPAIAWPLRATPRPCDCQSEASDFAPRPIAN